MKSVVICGSRRFKKEIGEFAARLWENQFMLWKKTKKNPAEMFCLMKLLKHQEN